MSTSIKLSRDYNSLDSDSSTTDLIEGLINIFEWHHHETPIAVLEISKEEIFSINNRHHRDCKHFFRAIFKPGSAVIRIYTEGFGHWGQTLSYVEMIAPVNLDELLLPFDKEQSGIVE